MGEKKDVSEERRPLDEAKGGDARQEKGVKVVVKGDIIVHGGIRVPIRPSPMLTRGYPAGALVRRGRGL